LRLRPAGHHQKPATVSLKDYFELKFIKNIELSLRS